MGTVHCFQHVRLFRQHEMVEAVRVLVRICSDETIASVVTRSGLVTGMGNRWTRERVTSYGQDIRTP